MLPSIQIVETAKANNPNVYKYLLTELPKYRDENGNIEYRSKLDPLPAVGSGIT